MICCLVFFFFFIRFVVFFFFFCCSSRRRHTRLTCDWSSAVCSSDLGGGGARGARGAVPPRAGAPGGGVGRDRRRVPPPAGVELFHRCRAGGAGRRCCGRGARAAVRRVGRQERGCWGQPRRAG